MKYSNTVKIIGQILLFGVLAWLVVHFFSVFGLFLFLAYPVWWLIFPDRKICFLCRIQGQGKNCHHCTRDLKVSHNMGVTTMIMNMVFIFVFTAVSIMVVAAEYFIITRFFYHPPQTAHFNIASQRTVYQGKLFPVELVLDGIERPINAVQLDLEFDPKQLEVVDFVTKDSFINIFVEKKIDNSLGFVRVSGGIPNPGYNKKIGLFGNLMVRAKTTGVVTVKILPSSAVLLNDGKGTNVMRNLGEFSYLVLPIDDKIDVGDPEVESAFILGAQAEAAKNQFYFYDENDTIYPVKNEPEDEVVIRTNHPVVEFLHGIDSFIIQLITFSF
ncbi:MAG: hypothetical protein IAE95_14525 [Chitinophagaceae bacterium]|nr:hypothetical protein [Chitinophagaceae bacterium]